MSDSSMKVVDKLFNIMHYINSSDNSLNAIELSEELGYGIRTVQRLVMRLANEGLIGIKGGASNTYVYYRLRGEV